MVRRATKPVGRGPSPRVKYPAFGALLKTLRGERSVQQVLNHLERQRPEIQATQGTVSGYEQGYVKKLDPLVIWGLAQAYNQPLEGLLAALHANRENPTLSLGEAQGIVQRYKHGPSPAMATEALAKAEQRLFDTAAVIAEIRLQIAPAGRDDHAETKPRG